MTKLGYGGSAAAGAGDGLALRGRRVGGAVAPLGGERRPVAVVGRPALGSGDGGGGAVGDDKA